MGLTDGISKQNGINSVSNTLTDGNQPAASNNPESTINTQRQDTAQELIQPKNHLKIEQPNYQITMNT